MSEIKVDILSKNDGTEREDLAKGWVNYNQITPIIRDSFNVSSVTDVSLGVLTVVWNIDFANSDYAMGAMVGNDSDAGTNLFASTRLISVGSVKIEVRTFANNLVDIASVSIVAFGDQT